MNGDAIVQVTSALLKSVGSNFQFAELELDEPKANEVLVKLVASGVCHTDAAAKEGMLPVPFPAVLGHEGSGIIEKVGEAVTDYAVGDHVVIGFSSCGKCEACRSGNPGACERFNELNMGGSMADHTHRIHTMDGKDVSVFFGQSSFSTYATVNENNLAKVPNDVDLRMLGPLGCGFMTGSGTVLNSLDPEAGSTLLVFGTGAVGLAGVMAGKIANAGHIVAIDIHDERLEIAKELGATEIINSSSEDAVERVKEITSGKGAQYALDTTGVPSVINSALKSLAIKGELATVGVGKGPFAVDVSGEIMTYARTLKGVIEGDAVPQTFIPKLVEFYRKGQFEINELSKFYSFEDIDQAFEDSKNGETVKPILIIDPNYSL